ncbi:N-acetyltransferase family protein [Ectopseudomonas mendocina]|uniref:L-methionine sulfoximine/L-methionine sulfone acetyltransferase n=1 Tax=Ectopseudomonas mendocina TaxID=300 RepID=A0ABD7RXI8_ECTME|nr:GNAT family N-acetyltransferase [Pseudomonas mendocina]TRO15014.1 N-acetyltransferase family protein [Pseudomonas mendocina]TRO18325.1 N-acetyltransferase family protein [Pseudomonas mendocina]
MSYSIVDASEADLPGILAIYNDAVQHTTAIWNETLVDLANRRAWLTERTAAGFPVLVARDAAGEVLGYASYGTWRPHDGYKHTVEHSVYVRVDQRGQGLGPTLMQALIERARAANLHVMVGAIESENAASIRLHQRLGFVTSGQMPQVGRKFGRWLDLTFMQLILGAKE